MGFGSLAGGGGDSRARTGIALFGDREVLRAFDLLPPKLQKKYGRRGVMKAGRRVVRSAKQKAPKRTGALKKSLGVRTRTYSQSGTVVAIVGPRSNIKHTKAARIARTMASAAGGKGPAKRIHDPAKIAHLVELGHGGPHAAEAKPFLRPAFDENKTLCLTIIAAELELGLRELGPGRVYLPSGF